MWVQCENNVIRALILQWVAGINLPLEYWNTPLWVSLWVKGGKSKKKKKKYSLKLIYWCIALNHAIIAIFLAHVRIMKECISLSLCCASVLLWHSAGNRSHTSTFILPPVPLMRRVKPRWKMSKRAAPIDQQFIYYFDPRYSSNSEISCYCYIISYLHTIKPNKAVTKLKVISSNVSFCPGQASTKIFSLLSSI